MSMMINELKKCGNKLVKVDKNRKPTLESLIRLQNEIDSKIKQNIRDSMKGANPYPQ